MIQNRQWRVVHGALWMSMLFLAGIFLPSWLEMDMMRYGFGIATLCGFACLTAVVTAWMYAKQARALDKILNGEQVLGHWTVSEADWRTFTGMDYAEQMGRNKSLLILTLSLTAVIAIGLTLVSGDPLFLVICSGIALMVTIAAYLGPMWYQKQQQDNREVIIAESGVYCGGRFAYWDLITIQLDAVTLRQDTIPALLAFDFTYLNGRMVNSDTMRVPVPINALDIARKIEAHFNS